MKNKNQFKQRAFVSVYKFHTLWASQSIDKCPPRFIASINIPCLAKLLKESNTVNIIIFGPITVNVRFYSLMVRSDSHLPVQYICIPNLISLMSLNFNNIHSYMHFWKEICLCFTLRTLLF